MSTLKSEMRDDLADNHSVFHSVTERLLVPAASSPDPEEKHVAFYAYMTSSMVNPGSHQILKFDHVKTNIGHGYHNNTGVLLHPHPGFTSSRGLSGRQQVPYILWNSSSLMRFMDPCIEIQIVITMAIPVKQALFVFKLGMMYTCE